MPDSVYDHNFFDYVSLGARRSAQIVVPIVMRNFDVESVADIGSGRGAWLAEWQANGIVDNVGVDGDYIDRSSLMIAADRFVQQDITKSFDLNRKFDIVTSLEVGEHIAPSATDIFVDNLARHADAILFSAATPGQGGTHHVNEQIYEFWREKFAARGYRVFDFLRPQIASDKRIEPWYRYNTLFFARGDAVENLSESILRTEVKPDRKVQDISPVTWRARKAIIRLLPPIFIEFLVEIKHRYTKMRSR